MKPLLIKLLSLSWVKNSAGCLADIPHSSSGKPSQFFHLSVLPPFPSPCCFILGLDSASTPKFWPRGVKNGPVSKFWDSDCWESHRTRAQWDLQEPFYSRLHLRPLPWPCQSPGRQRFRASPSLIVWRPHHLKLPRLLRVVVLQVRSHRRTTVIRLHWGPEWCHSICGLKT